MSRTKNALRVVISNIINQIVLIIAGLLLPPLIISNYGSAINGLINSVKQILNYFSVVSVGLGAAGQVTLYEPLAKKNQKKINYIMNEITTFFNKVSYILLLLIGIFAFILPVLRKGEINEIVVFSIVLICGFGSFLEFKYLQKYKILLLADQKQFITYNVNSQGTIINLLFSIILIYLNAPIIMVQLVATLAYVVRMCLMTNKIKKIYPNLNLKEKSKKVIIKNKKGALFYKMSDIIMNYVPITLVTIIFGFVEVSIYSVYNTIFSSITMIVNVFSSGFASSFGNILVENKNKSIHNSFIGYSFIVRVISFFLYCCSAVLIVPFVSVYIKNTDGVNYMIPSLGMLFAITGLLRALKIPSLTIIDALGKYDKKNIKLNYIEVIINIIISIIASLKFGIIGVLIGSAISYLFRGILLIINIYKNNINESSSKEFIRIILNFLLFCILYFILKDITVSSYIGWFIQAFKVAIICGLSFIILNILIDRYAFLEFYKRVKNIFTK